MQLAKNEDDKWLYANVINKMYVVFLLVHVIDKTNIYFLDSH